MKASPHGLLNAGHIGFGYQMLMRRALRDRNVMYCRLAPPRGRRTLPVVVRGIALCLPRPVAPPCNPSTYKREYTYGGGNIHVNQCLQVTRGARVFKAYKCDTARVRLVV